MPPIVRPNSFIPPQDEEQDGKLTNPPTPETQPKPAPSVMFAEAQAAEPDVPTKVPTQDEVIQDYIKQDKLPPDRPDIYQAIKEGKLSSTKAFDDWNTFKQKNKIISIDSDGNVDRPAEVQREAVTRDSWKESSKKFFDEVNQVRYIDPRIPKIDPGTGAPLDDANRAKLSDQLLAEEQKSKELQAYSKNLPGRLIDQTMRSYSYGNIQIQPSDELPEVDRTVGMIIDTSRDISLFEGAGAIVGGLPFLGNLLNSSQALLKTEKALKNAKVAAEGAGLTDEIVKLGDALRSTQRARYVKDITRVTAESGIVGGGTEAVSSAIKNRKRDDVLQQVLEDGITGTFLFGALGAALYPVAEAAGSIFSKFKENRSLNTIKAVASEPDVQALAKSGLSESTSKKLFEGSKAGTLSPEEQLAADALQKIKDIKPLVGTQSALLSNPELLRVEMSERARTVSNQVFGDNGVLKDLLETSPQLKLLVDTGKHLEALDSVQTVMTDAISQNPDLKEFITAPFLNNSKTLDKAYASRLVDTVKNPERFPNLRSNILNYLDNPVPENWLLLQQNAPRKFYDKITKEKFLDGRLNPQEIDQMVGDFTQEALSGIAGEAKLNMSAFGKLKTTDDFLKTAVTFNKELSRNFIEAYAQNPFIFDENFKKVNPELMEGVQKTVQLKRLTEERGLTIQRRREASLALNDLTKQAQSTSDEGAVQQINLQIAQLKDKQRVLASILTDQNRDIRSISVGMQGTAPDKLQEINDFVNEIYLPKRGQQGFESALETRIGYRSDIKNKQKELLSARQAGDVNLQKDVYKEIQELRQRERTNVTIEQPQKYNKKFGGDQNPYFIAKDSELADVMNAFVVAGTDIKSDLSKTFSLPFGININNPRRMMNKELGHNNVMEKLFDEVQNRQVAIESSKKKYAQMIDDIGIKPGSKESALLQKFGEKRLLPNDPEFLALPASTREKILNGHQVARNFYDGLIDTLNLVMRENNLPQVKKRDDYFFHFGETMESLPSMIKDFLRGNAQDVEQVSLKGEGPRLFWKSKIQNDPNRTFFASEKARKGGEFIDDAITGMHAYMGPALERIYLTDIVRKVDNARFFAPENLGNFLQGIKEDYLLRQPNLLDKETSKTAKALMLGIRDRIGRGAILGNINTVFQQIASIPQNMAVSPLHAAKAMMHMFTDEGRQIAGMSKNLKLADPFHSEIDKEAALFKNTVLKQVLGEKTGQVVAKGSAYTNKVMSSMMKYGLKVFDGMARKHGFLTGYYKGKASGLTMDQAVKFGDKWAEMIQNNTSRIAQPKIYQSAVGKALGQFTSFVNNYAASIVNDIPNIAKTEGGAKAVGMIVKSVAGMSLTNELARAAGIPAPFDVLNHIPFLGTQRWGAPGFAEIARDVPMAIAGNEKEQPRALEGLKRTAAALAIPGGGQIYKTYNSLSEQKSGRIRTGSQKVMDAAFGRSGRMKQEEDIQKNYKRLGSGKGVKGFTKRQVRGLIQTIRGEE